VADIGFEYTLGTKGCFQGPDFIKQQLKDNIYCLPRLEERLQRAMQCAMDLETQPDARCVETHTTMTSDDNNNSNTAIVVVKDLFELSRRVMLRVMLDIFLGQSVRIDATLIDDIMIFEDKIEDATAKAAVLPSFIAVPFYLNPTKRARLALQAQLADRMDEAWNQHQQEATKKEDDNNSNNNNNDDDDDDKVGPWLRECKTSSFMTREDAAELTVSLIFASHKNASIGAAQSFCFLQTQVDAKLREEAQKEAAADSVSSIVQKCVLETMRATAHTIGAIRTAMQPFVLETSDGKSYEIQRGEVIAVSHWLPHQSRSDWGRDACRFNPDREIPKDSLVTFSGGIHHCPGERLAIKLMSMTVSGWLRNKMQLADRHRLPAISFERATLAQRKNNVKVTLVVNQSKK